MPRLLWIVLAVGLSACAKHWSKTEAYQTWQTEHERHCGAEALEHVASEFNYPLSSRSGTSYEVYLLQCTANAKLLKSIEANKKFKQDKVVSVTFPRTSQFVKAPSGAGLHGLCPDLESLQQANQSQCKLSESGSRGKKSLNLTTKVKSRYSGSSTKTHATFKGGELTVKNSLARLDDQQFPLCMKWLDEDIPALYATINEQIADQNDMQTGLVNFMKTQGMVPTTYRVDGSTQVRENWSPTPFDECQVPAGIAAMGKKMREIDIDRRSKPHVAHTNDAYRYCARAEPLAKRKTEWCAKQWKDLKKTESEYSRKRSQTSQLSAARRQGGYAAFNYDWSDFTDHIARVQKRLSKSCIPYGLLRGTEAPKGKIWAQYLGERIAHCETADANAWQAKARSTAITDAQKTKLEQFLTDIPAIKTDLKTAQKVHE